MTAAGSEDATITFCELARVWVGPQSFECEAFALSEMFALGETTVLLGAPSRWEAGARA